MKLLLTFILNKFLIPLLLIIIIAGCQTERSARARIVDYFKSEMGDQSQFVLDIDCKIIDFNSGLLSSSPYSYCSFSTARNILPELKNNLKLKASEFSSYGRLLEENFMHGANACLFNKDIFTHEIPTDFQNAKGINVFRVRPDKNIFVLSLSERSLLSSKTGLELRVMYYNTTKKMGCVHIFERGWPD